MQRVFVLDTNKEPLMPCRPARARIMLGEGKAAVYRRCPFTIILKQAVEEPQTQPTELRVDPGSKTTGLSIVAQFARGWVVLWAANLQHRGSIIREKLDKRRTIRRGRRNRKTRYRQPRFLNRCRPKGWLAPSLRSRVDNVAHWGQKITRFTPVSFIAVETVRFDTQAIANPEISGVEYQQGELYGYEVREYLLEKWGRKCAYCSAENARLQVEHIHPKSRGGTNRVSNLTLACEPCNARKGNRPIDEFLAGDPARLKRILAQAQAPLKDAAAVNAIRWAIGDALKLLGLPTTFWSGGRTKRNRVTQDYPKDHWIDAACVGEFGDIVHVPDGTKPLLIKAVGRGARQMCKMDKYGFPRSGPKSVKRIYGFQTGDMVRADVPKGKYAGIYIGKVAIRASGKFLLSSIDTNWKYCRLLQRADGYEYSLGEPYGTKAAQAQVQV